MGICLSGNMDDQGPDNHPVTRILCLGIGGCGKTTFVRQMKIMHNVKWEDVEIDRFTQLIRKLVTIGMSDIINVAKKMKLQFSAENESNVESIKEFARDREKSSVSAENIEILRAVWEDPTSQLIVKQYQERIATTHIAYFWENIDRIMQDSFKPTDEDILRIRMRTVGAYSTIVRIERNYFEFFDVGGQKPERAKWEKLLQSQEFSCILYFLATDEWDVMDEEREIDSTKMEMSRIIFKEVLSSKDIPEDVPIILFMNRSDLFSERIKNKESFESFQNTFQQYTGGQDPEAAMDHLCKKFTEDTPKRKDPTKFYITNALDRHSMEPVWKAVKEHALQRAVKNMGL